MSKEETDTSDQGNAGSGSSQKETGAAVKIKPLGSVDICICNRCAGPFHVIPSAGKH